MLIGAAPLHVELPSVEIKLEGTAPSPAEKYKILLKAEGSLTSPMPSGSTDEGYVLSIKGSGTEKLPVLSVSYTHLYGLPSERFLSMNWYTGSSIGAHCRMTLITRKSVLRSEEMCIRDSNKIFAWSKVLYIWNLLL